MNPTGQMHFCCPALIKQIPSFLHNAFGIPSNFSTQKLHLTFTETSAQKVINYKLLYLPLQLFPTDVGKPETEILKICMDCFFT